MAADAQTTAIAEAVVYLEQQLRSLREEHSKALGIQEQLRRQVHELQKLLDEQRTSVREVDARFGPFRGLPEKLRALDEGAEQIRQSLAATRATLENDLRLLRAETEHSREERAHAVRRAEGVADDVGLIGADVGQLQAQVTNVVASAQTLIERQRDVEARVDQFGLRLDRAIELHRDLETRLRDVLVSDQEARFEVVTERLQVVGEMVRRNEELIREATAEQTMREEVLQEIGLWRDEHSRIDGRLAALEETLARALGQIDKVQGEVTLVEGRHSGLSERVAGIRRDIAEVVDHVRDEFAKFNQLTEKQRRKQIQLLEQELRELKFHGFHPPEEP